MGGDGGSSVSRIDMVKTKGYGSAQQSWQGAMGSQPNGVRRISAEGIDSKEIRRVKMSTCALTGEVLARPIVACRAGYLFNKESLVRALLDRSIPAQFSHISNLKDILQLNLEYVQEVPVCPITRRDLNDGVTRSDALWPCGCVLSEKALLNITKENVCLNCGSKIDMRTKLNPEGSTLEAQLKVANSMRTSRKKGIKADPEPGTFKKVKQTPEFSKATSRSIYNKLFHDSTSSKQEKTDAFGRAFSSKGVGV